MLLGIVLAGGASKRMGQDKALLSINGKTMLSRAQQLLAQAGCDKVLVSRNSPGFVQDIIAHQGPLSGVHACLTHQPCDGALVIPIDMPLLRAQQLNTLIAFSRQNHVSSYFNSTVLPCFLAHPSLALNVITERLAQQQRSLTGLLHALQAKPCDDEKGSTDLALMNTNTPAQWQQALHYFAHKEAL